MKKIFFKAIPVIGIAFLFSTAARAQVTSEIRDFYDNSIVTNDTMYFWLGLGGVHAYNFNQYNIGSVTTTYKVAKTHVQIMSGASSNFCIYHNADGGDPQSQCYIPTVFLSGNFITDPGEFNTLLADFSAGSTTTGISIVQYRFYDINNPADSARITLVYNVTPVGIAESFVGSLGEPYPNPSNGAVNIPYDFAGENAEILVTDAAGRAVYRETLSKGTVIAQLNTSEWAEGIYIVMMMNESVVIGRKMLVVE